MGGASATRVLGGPMRYIKSCLVAVIAEKHGQILSRGCECQVVVGDA